MKYRGQLFFIKLVNYDIEYYSTKKFGVIILFINKHISNKEKSKILHKTLKAWRWSKLLIILYVFKFTTYNINNVMNYVEHIVCICSTW